MNDGLSTPLSRAGRYLLVLILVAVSGFPVYWMLTTALSLSSEYRSFTWAAGAHVATGTGRANRGALSQGHTCKSDGTPST